MSPTEAMICPRCGTVVPPDAPEGLCLLCLVREGAAARRRMPSASSRLPAAFAGYEIREELGRGGMGRVFRARQIGLDRIVALKVIADGELASASAVERFRTEAEAAASLSHPNIVPIYEVGEDGSWNFFSMQLIDGPTLSRVLADGPLSFERAARLMSTVSRAIHHAHERGVLHRDIKPGNILLDAAGEPHVTDFGLAKFTERDSALTLTHTALGTPAYMSPEQASGRTREITTSADVYGLGAVLYETLTGKAPFCGETPMAVARQVLEREPASPSTVNRAVPAELAVICLKCLEKDPARRYPSAAALADDLERWLRHEPIAARAATPWDRTRKWSRRRPAEAVLVVTVLAALVSLVAGLLVHNRRISHAQRETLAAATSLTRQLRRVEWDQAETFAAEGRTADAAVLFARFLRETPGDLDVASRLVSLLESRAFPMPVLPPMEHGSPVTQLRLDAAHRRLYTVTDDGRLRAWSLETGAEEKLAELNLSAVLLDDLGGGERLLVADKQGQVLVWQTREWRLERELGRIEPERPRIQSGAEGRLVSLVTRAGQLESWSTVTGECIARAPLPVQVCGLSTEVGPDGETVVSGSATGLWLWMPRRGEMRPLLGLTEAVTGVGADWKRRRLVASVATALGTAPGLVGLEVDSGREYARVGHSKPWQVFRFAPDGRRLLVACWGFGTMALDPATLLPSSPEFGASPVLPNFSHDASFSVAYTAAHDGTGRLFEISTGRALLEPVQVDGGDHVHDLSPDGRLLATGAKSGAARLWDLRMRSPDTVLLRVPGEVTGLDLSPDARRCVTANFREARVYDLASRQPVTPPMPANYTLFKARFSPDGRRIATASFDWRIRVWDAADGRPIGPGWRHEERAIDAVFSPDGTRVASRSGDGTARVLDAETGQPVGPPFRHGQEVTHVEFSRDGKLLATCSVDTTARVWDAATGATVGPVLQHRGTVWTARFDAAGRRLLTASSDRTARIWRVGSGEPDAPPIRSDRNVYGAVFSPDGRRVLVSTEADARIFDARTSEPLTPPMRHGGRVWYAFYSPDGRWVASASEDKSARIWSAETGFPVTEPLAHQAMVGALCWFPDSRRLLTGAYDSTVRLWSRPEMGTVPVWLPDLVEALAGRGSDGHGGAVAVGMTRLDELRRQARSSSVGDPWSRWLHWFLIERLEGSARNP